MGDNEEWNVHVNGCDDILPTWWGDGSRWIIEKFPNPFSFPQWAIRPPEVGEVPGAAIYFPSFESARAAFAAGGNDPRRLELK
jgi:hypothetical protein